MHNALEDRASFVPYPRAPRGRKTLKELLSLIDQEEIHLLNELLGDEHHDLPQGKELI